MVKAASFWLTPKYVAAFAMTADMPVPMRLFTFVMPAFVVSLP